MAGLCEGGNEPPGSLKANKSVHNVEGGCQQTRQTHRIWERVKKSMMGRSEACIRAHIGHFEHFLLKLKHFEENNRQDRYPYADKPDRPPWKCKLDECTFTREVRSLYLPSKAADSLDRPPWNVVQRCWMASAMAPEADLVWGGVSPRTDRGVLGEFAEAGIVYGFCRL
ncbi:hypothetical protein ANN_13841 [Periplaneta americana]|uniref:Uncharacterized protein n=1 Tax=Periplaneta americana TaxID=6978 RepID=A0ABQ8SW74_PERAM|nr:hypothetical protein ANN_13841 [Periplaneta americana]